MTINLSDAGHWLVLLLIAAVVGLVVELLRGGGLPLGFLGEIALAGVGAWVGGDLLQTRFVLMPQPSYEGVALIPAAVGALLLGFLWGLLGGRRKRRSY